MIKYSSILIQQGVVIFLSCDSVLVIKAFSIERKNELYVSVLSPGSSLLDRW